MANLSDLPMELLLKVMEYEKPLDQQRFLGALRGTCAALHARTLHYFGSRYVKHVEVSLTEADVSILRATSQSALSVYIKNLVINVDGLYEEFHESRHGIRITRPFEVWDHPIEDKCLIDDSVVKFLESRSCKQILGEALNRLKGLDSICIRGPPILAAVHGPKLREEVGRVAGVAARVLLHTVLTKGTAKNFVVEREDERYHMSLSALEAVSASATDSASSIEKLRLALAHDVAEDSFPQHARTTATVLLNLPNLTDLHLSLYHSPSPYITALSKVLSPMRLRRLHLTHISASHTALYNILDATAPTIRSFTLKSSTIDSCAGFHYFLERLFYLDKLSELVLHKLNAGDKGVNFGILNSMRPGMIDFSAPNVPKGENWVYVFGKKDAEGIKVREDEGDDVIDSLAEIGGHVELGSKWNI